MLEVNNALVLCTTALFSQTNIDNCTVTTSLRLARQSFHNLWNEKNKTGRPLMQDLLGTVFHQVMSTPAQETTAQIYSTALSYHIMSFG